MKRSLVCARGALAARFWSWCGVVGALVVAGACSRGGTGEAACVSQACADSVRRDAALLGASLQGSAGAGELDSRWPDPCRGLECATGWPGCTFVACEAAAACGKGEGGELFVRTDYEGEERGTKAQPYRSLNAAVAAAESGAAVNVARGVYQEPVVVRDKRVHLCGGWSEDFASRDAALHLTELAPNKDAVAVSLVNSGDSSVVGFVVRGARLGIWVDSEMWPPTRENSAPLISGNVIEDNGNTTMGSQSAQGAIAMGNGYLTVVGNTLRDNRGDKGAALAAKGKSVTMIGNRVIGNVGGSDHGGGAYLAVEEAALTSNLFQSNSVGAVAGYGWGGGAISLGVARLVGNVWTDNMAPSHGGGLFVDEGSSVTMEHEVFFSNQCGQEGGAAFAVDGSWSGEISKVNASHITVANHVCPNQGAILLEANAEMTVWNSVLWNPEALDIHFQETNCAATLAYSTLGHAEGDGRDGNRLTRGAGCLEGDPLFVAPGSGDFHLASRGGHWDPVARRWVSDQNTSRAVDGGDPAAPFGAEAVPHGNRANQGAFGNTPQASRTP